MFIKRLLFIGYLIFWPVLIHVTPLWGGVEDKALEKTLLFFVGENLEVLTLASKKAESAVNAPAVARVINSGEIERRGVNTLAELLETEPGFYMNSRASGTIPYLRGVQSGILFLYDGVPLTTNATRNANALDYEISLSNVQRIEIIRGPGSVLWGADAFAGIVNIVPFKGNDIKGVEAEVFAGSNRYSGGSIKGGKKNKSSDTFLSISYARDRYHKSAYKIDSSIATASGNYLKNIDDSNYFELTGNSSLGEKIKLSGRLSDNEREYVMNDSGSLTWRGKRESPSGFIKGTYEDRFKGFDLTLTGYFQYIENNVTNVDIEQEQSDLIYSGEMLWYKAVSESAQFTFGSSFRRNHVDGAVAENNFLPISLKPGNSVFIPSADQVNYTNTLISAFGQYRHKWGGHTDSWLGIRYDNHSEYDDTLSYSMGINSPLTDDLRVKLVYGTAFRTPYPNQLIGADPLDPEQINTANIQALLAVDPKKSLSLNLFYSNISNYVFEDPYGGLSFPSEIKIWGAELSASAVLTKEFDFYLSLTALNSDAQNIRYRIPSYTFVRPDGQKITVYEEWTQPYDSGPEYLASLGFAWKFMPKKLLTANFKWTGDIPYSFDKDVNSGNFDITPNVSLGLKWQDFLGTKTILSLKVDNLFDTKNNTPGRYGPVEESPLQVYLKLSYKF
ncbi:MAG: TonB-dependent receptor plug domain-containing protein [Desulfobacula sp.]|jgi:outer membrane cobalamin receptor|uniref:TonB-dependent receptor plug domain-containing protein n=1 Tax=Desulfobacula sp. TaxID=2593537 RepID=UPI001DFA46D4|nr:TonB-dependent receptor plug domain-containing protein [Desulfobacula sp.]MBT3485996.1 TonB-dependent receptor plug domain-containing protein [Desulfobacula sp.]MBT3804046.1 TonB-dependent receptor plug domain-containing protein [Desulfobacula sp.]MBT4026397.1 TonB-dependent receptor plug domain-containing protein [Desulfobacula sp.]MBT4200455.1 TonB-dependent receptor plug domain-containing protein [Desulfobacula sp.]